MGIEADLREIKQMVAETSMKLDEIIVERETAEVMRLSEPSISEIYEGEPGPLQA